MDTLVKLYGLNHSGSHYLAWLLHNNFNNIGILHSHTGWNHGPIVDEFLWDASKWNTDPYFDGDKKKHGELLKKEGLNSGKTVVDYKKQLEELYSKKELPLLILIRNPYTWLQSYCIKHYEDSSGRDLARAMKLWSDINRNYINAIYPKRHFIKYEKLRDNTKDELQKISNFLNIPLTEEFLDTDKDAITLHRNLGEGGKYIKVSEQDYNMLINQLCKKEGISHKVFSDMFNSLIDKNILDWYNKL